MSRRCDFSKSPVKVRHLTEEKIFYFYSSCWKKQGLKVYGQWNPILAPGCLLYATENVFLTQNVIMTYDV